MSTAKKLPRITAEEYFKMTEHSEERTELIDGEIIALSGAVQIHQDISGGLYMKVRQYIHDNQGSCHPFSAPFDVVLEDNVVQPDVLVVCDPQKLDGKRCIGAPDWVVEVTSTNARMDYVQKMAIYKNSGVKEYWIIDPELKKTVVYLFNNGRANISLYEWDAPIPVALYQNAPVPLSITVSELEII